MPDTFNLEHEPQAVPAAPTEPRKIHCLYGGAVLFGDQREAVDNGEGMTLDSGDSITTDHRIWLRAKDYRMPAKVLVEDA